MQRYCIFLEFEMAMNNSIYDDTKRPPLPKSEMTINYRYE